MTDQREILEKVAAGELSPEEAAEMLDDPRPALESEPIERPAGYGFDLGSLGSVADELREVGRHLREEVSRELRGVGDEIRRETRGRAPRPEREPDAEDGGRGEPLFPEARVTSLHLIGAFRTTVVVGDPTVRTVAVDGPHRARLDGSTLVIDADDESLEGFRFETRHGVRRGRHFRLGVDNPRPLPLRVRANPSLPIVAEVAAGSLKIIEMRDAITAEVAAGTLVITGATGPLHLSTAAGPIKVQGKLTSGQHKIRCEAGAVKLVLDRDSDVRIHAKASLGKVVLPGVVGPAGFAIGSSDAEAVIGAGTANLEIECAVGGVKVVLDGDDR